MQQQSALAVVVRPVPAITAIAIAAAATVTAAAAAPLGWTRTVLAVRAGQAGGGAGQRLILPAGARRAGIAAA
jgi:hypothetical protein